MSEHEPDNTPADDRPRPQYGELAPPGWVWRPPEDAQRLDTTRPHPTASETEPALTAPSQRAEKSPRDSSDPSDQKPPLRPDAPRWNLTFTIILLAVGFFGMSYSIGALQSTPAAMELLHTSQNLGHYVQDPSVSSFVTAGSIATVGIWAISTGISIWLLARKRLAFYIPLIAGTVALVVLFVVLGFIFSTDPALLNFYSGISTSNPAPSSADPISPPPELTPLPDTTIST